MRKGNRRKFKVTPNTALQGAIVVLCRQPLGRRIQVCLAILFKRYAKNVVVDHKGRKVTK